MDIKEFLEQFVEGYLFADLDNMAKIKVDGDGNCGYPMVMSILAGIELLGTLTYPHSLPFGEPESSDSGDEEVGEVGNPQFGWYWKHFLTPTDRRRYKIKGGISDLIRSLLRNGLAHAFLAKPGIEVTKFEPNSHMRSSATSRLIIDSTKFAEDFKRSYRDYVRPILDGKPAIIKDHTISLQTMQDRLNELASAYMDEAEKSFGGLLGQILRAPNTQTASVTGSLNFSPPGTISFTIKHIASKGLEE